MWDLETIIRMNNEAFRAFKAKNTTPSSKQKKAGRDAGVWPLKASVFGEASSLRSVYEGERNGCSSQGREGEELS
jgi:hypothetical protein